MQARKSENADTKDGDSDFELKLLTWVDSIMALTGLARIDFERTLSAAPQWVVLSLARAPVWLLFWLSLSALISYLVYDATQSVTWALVSLVVLQGVVGLLLELRLSSLRDRFTFARARRNLAASVVGSRWRSRAYLRRARKTAELRSAELRERILRNVHIAETGGPDVDRDELKARVAMPLVGLALLAGVVAGSSKGKFANLLHEPMMRDVWHVVGKITEDFTRGHH